MGKAVVLSETRGYFRHWANQFVNADSSNRDIVLVDPRRIDRNPTATQLMRYVNSFYGQAAKLAGQDGCVVVSLGHGGAHATNSTIGMVDLLPNRALRLQAEQVRYSGSDVEEGDRAVLGRIPTQRGCRQVLRSYDLDPDTRRRPPPDERVSDYMNCIGAQSARPRQQFQAAYAKVGELLRTNNVREVILLTCKVGHARSFVRNIAAFWRINIMAYEKRVAANRDDSSENPYHIYLVGEEHRLFRQQLPNRYAYRARPTEQRIEE